jgi:hypothetical protein
VRLHGVTSHQTVISTHSRPDSLLGQGLLIVFCKDGDEPSGAIEAGKGLSVATQTLPLSLNASPLMDRQGYRSQSPSQNTVHYATSVL